MKRFLATSLVCLITATTANANAEENKTVHHDGVHVGLGTGVLASLDITSTIGYNIAGVDVTRAAMLVPIDIKGVIRVEPYLTLSSFSRSQEDDQSTSDEGGALMGFGAGIFYIKDVSPSTLIGFGARLGPTFVSTSQTTTVKATNTTTESSTSRIDFGLQPTALGEYFLSNNFSLGAEVGLGINFIGNTSRDPEPPNADEESGTVISTAGGVFVRWFFM